jgi:hypothetical protein
MNSSSESIRSSQKAGALVRLHSLGCSVHAKRTGRRRSMRIASRFQRSGRSNDRRARALTAGVWVGLISFGCFFELEPLEEPDGGIGGGGTFGAVGGEAGESPMGGDGGGGVAGMPPQDGCEQAGQKRCDGKCVDADPEHGCSNEDCTPCAPVDNGTRSCSSDNGSCKVESCAPGFADCDGDTLVYNGQSGGNGCEYSFMQNTTLRASNQQPLEVPRKAIVISDGSRDDWSGVPAYALDQTCDNCIDTALPDVAAKNEVPPRSDLDAYFRVAWDENFFYMLGDVYDRNPLSNGAEGGGICQGGALCEDAFTLFFDGRNNRNQPGGESYNIDDPRIFVSLGNRSYWVSGPPVAPPHVDLKAVTTHGPYCYRLEAQVSWTLIVGIQGNADAFPDQFPPKPGNQYGFDISVNDWDPGVSVDTESRESQLFWVNPGAGYHEVTTGFGAMTLVEQVSPEPLQ